MLSDEEKRRDGSVTVPDPSQLFDRPRDAVAYIKHLDSRETFREDRINQARETREKQREANIKQVVQVGPVLLLRSRPTCLCITYVESLNLNIQALKIRGQKGSSGSATTHASSFVKDAKRITNTTMGAAAAYTSKV